MLKMETLSKQVYPKNLQEFIDQGWEKFIQYRIASFTLKDTLNNPEDLGQEILLSLLKTNYLDRYVPERGAFKAYLFSFVDNFLKKKYNKEHTRYGRHIVAAASLSQSPSDEAVFDGTEVFADLLPSDDDCETSVMLQVLIESIRKELAASFTASSANVYNGKVYLRDPVTVFNLMIKGASVMDVAMTLNVSRQFVYYLLKNIRTSKAYQIYSEVLN